jgi:hypothetical protein
MVIRLSSRRAKEKESGSQQLALKVSDDLLILLQRVCLPGQLSWDVHRHRPEGNTSTPAMKHWCTCQTGIRDFLGECLDFL